MYFLEAEIFGDDGVVVGYTDLNIFDDVEVVIVLSEQG